MELSGIEQVSLELAGTLDRAAAERAAPGLPLDGEERVPFGVLLLHMCRLGPAGVPGVGLSYGEALWRVGVRFQGAPAWFASVCDLDSSAVRILAARLIRYPVRAATVQLLDVDPPGGLRAEVTTAAGRLALEARPGTDAPRPAPPLPVLVRSRAVLRRVPWAEEPAPWRRTCRVAVNDDSLVRATLGDGARLDAEALLHRGRVHRCGFARPVR